MSTLSNVIVYVWLLPLVVFIIVPLLMLAVNLLGRFMYFMFFPRRLRVKESEQDFPAEGQEKAV